MKRWPLVIATCLMIAFLYGCTGTSADQGGSGKTDYQETKKMLIDLLKSDDGKKAIREILTDEKMKKQLLMDQDFVIKTVQDTLTSKEGKAFWQSLIKDPTFAKTLAETMAKQNKKLLKELMKDPEYQDLMMTVMKSPEMEQHYLELMKSKSYRKQVQQLMLDNLKSPVLREKINATLQKVVEEEMKKSGGGQQKQSQ